MRFAVHTFTVSPHQLPLAKQILAMGKDIPDFSFIYMPHCDMGAERRNLGWQIEDYPWIVSTADKANMRRRCEEADFLCSSIRSVDVFKKRAEEKKTTVYCSERWLKPMIGIARLFMPSFWRMARRMVSLLSQDAGFYYFPMGIHAARDMARICGLMHGDLRCLFRAPELEFESKPGGAIFLATKNTKNAKDAKKYCLDKMRMWGYFVEQGTGNREQGIGNREQGIGNGTSFKVLWVGRLLQWKRVDTIVKAVGEYVTQRRGNDLSAKITLDIYGTGPEEARLKKMAAKYGDVIRFHQPVPISEVRKLMREHDLYVLSSNAYEGWGAVVSEALEEGMRVIATSDSGAGATLLPEERQFKSGDVRLMKMLLEKELQGKLPPVAIGKWTAKYAAQTILRFANEHYKGNA